MILRRFCNFVLFMIHFVIVVVVVCTSTNNEDNNNEKISTAGGEGEQDFDIILIKIGGSSITNKAIKETIDQESLNWFAESISNSISDEFLSSSSEEESSSSSSSEESFSAVVGQQRGRSSDEGFRNNNHHRRHQNNPTLPFVVKIRGPAPLFGTSDASNVIINKDIYDIQQIGQNTEDDVETTTTTSSSSKSNEGRQEESSSSSSHHDARQHHHHHRPLAYVVVHGAGSFGHFTAKEYGLKGQTSVPMNNNNNNNTTTTTTINDSNHHSRYSADDSFMMEQEHDRRQRRQQQQKLNKGLSETRISVQKLNQIVVTEFLNHNINSIGISPCFGIPGIEAHLTLQPQPIIAMLEDVVKRTIESRLVPILHGDACLYGPDGGVGILSGDHIVEVLGKSSWIKNVVFITDVDGVYDVDPSTIIKNNNPTTTNDDDAKLLRNIFVNKTTGILQTKLNATGSTHKHDVTGGIQTKLKSAASIVTTGKNVTIVKVRSLSAEQAIAQEDVIETGSIISCID